MNVDARHQQPPITTGGWTMTPTQQVSFRRNANDNPLMEIDDNDNTTNSLNDQSIIPIPLIIKANPRGTDPLLFQQVEPVMAAYEAPSAVKPLECVTRRGGTSI